MWEALAAAGSILSAAVILASVILALRQLREIRRATQLDGTMRVFARFHDPEFLHARRFVFSELADRLKDPEFVRELEAYGKTDPAKHPELSVLIFLNEIGALVKRGLIDGPTIYEYAQYTIIKASQQLAPVVRLERASMRNPYMWGTAEFLYDDICAWMRRDLQRHPKANPATGEPFTMEDLR